jgi:hypothetical protein
MNATFSNTGETCSTMSQVIILPPIGTVGTMQGGVLYAACAQNLALNELYGAQAYTVNGAGTQPTPTQTIANTVGGNIDGDNTN